MTRDDFMCSTRNRFSPSGRPTARAVGFFPAACCAMGELGSRIRAFFKYDTKMVVAKKNRKKHQLRLRTPAENRSSRCGHSSLQTGAALAPLFRQAQPPQVGPSLNAYCCFVDCDAATCHLPFRFTQVSVKRYFPLISCPLYVPFNVLVPAATAVLP